ncbi:hypothetical protein FGO68_gene17698 [Halteria grandinella]|uniref:FCP1 homology domain-containing protein n=1 Tax=Halteria grandinella TaxID=5974 RepID=A0A8J8T0N4_HALGN|nr:hypothetical protein FGO68_gene17698 [Halteria grandinella]
MEQASIQEVTTHLTAKVLISGEFATSVDQVVYEVSTTTEIRKQLQVQFFEKLLKQGNTDYIWVDARELADLLSEEMARTLVRVIEKFNPKAVELSKVFKSWKEFKAFEPVLERLNLQGGFPDLAKLKEYASKRFPVLVLIDVGGSIMCRTGEKIAVDHLSSSNFCQIKQHYHYYRPGFDHFLARLISHQRVQLGFYTSIMRKNVLPLLFQLFQCKNLRAYSTDISMIFDQSYNSDDARPGRKPFATKRCLERVLDDDHVKGNFTKDSILMIDSDVLKILDYPDNAITMKPYETEDVLQKTAGHEDILFEVATYLDGLLDSTESAPEYLNSHRKSGTTIFDHPEYVAYSSSQSKQGASASEIDACELQEQSQRSSLQD